LPPAPTVEAEMSKATFGGKKNGQYLKGMLYMNDENCWDFWELELHILYVYIFGYL